MAFWTSNRLAPFWAPPNSLMSAPAMKVRPSQISTMALTSASLMAASKAPARPSRTPADRAFTGGELRVTMAISPSRVRSVTELIAAMASLPLSFVETVV